MNINTEIMSSMDFVQRSGVKIPNAVIVSGVTQVVDQDDHIIDFLKKYGSIKKILFVDEDTSEFYQNLIVEYSYGTAVEDLNLILPYTYTVQGDPSVDYTVRTLSSVYQSKIGGNITKTYLTELKTLAKVSGIEYEQVLKEMISQISEDVEVMSVPVPEEASPTHAEATVMTPQHVTANEQQSPISLSDAQGHIGQNVTGSVPTSNEARAPSLSLSDMNPPEIQKVVVEHIVRGERVGAHLQSSVRLRSFSGKTPRPNNETDYDTWRSHIELLLNDPNMSSLQISRRILESLLSPAADVVRGLRPDSPPLTYLQLLDSAFGTVQDGEELFAQFLNTLQDPGEKPSTYLHRLQVALSLAAKRGGVAPEEVDKHLLKQFCRGCWDNALLSALQLEQKKSSPPSFPELLLMLRTEEDRQQTKASRMKKHIGATKQRVQIQSQDACACAEPKDKPEVNLNAIEDLKKQVASLQSQLASFMTQKKKGTNKKGAAEKSQSQISDSANTTMQKQTKMNQTNKPRPWYCFNCGGDGHISLSCTEAANPALVAEKKKKLQEKQRLWETNNSPSPHLNF